MTAVLARLPLAVLALGLAGCPSNSTPDAAPDAVADAASDAVSDAPSRDAPPDANAPDANAPDAATSDGASSDAPADAPAPDDAGRVSFTASVHNDTFAQSCMPIVQPDPLQFAGTFSLMNTGDVAVGPVAASRAIVLNAEGRELATFDIDPVSLPAVAPGATGMVMVTKRAGTLMPANGCMSVPCGTLVRVRLPLSGPNVPAGAFANSPLGMLMCAF